MADTHIKSTLDRKCAELENAIEKYRRFISDAQTDLVHLRGTAAVFSRDVVHSAETQYVSLRGYFHRNEVFSICRDALQKHPDGLDTRELAEICFRAKGLALNDRLLCKSMKQMIVQIMQVRRKCNQVVSTEKRGLLCVWKLP